MASKQLGIYLIFISILYQGYSEGKVRNVAPMHLIPGAQSVPGEYLVLLKSTLPSLPTVETRASDIKNHVSNVGERGLDILDMYSFGKFSALYIRATEQSLYALRTHHDVALVEPNFVTSIGGTTWNTKVDLGACLPQNSGAQLWGLSRISSEDLPDYDTAQYTYDADGGSDVTAYVIDSGVYVEHEDFEGRAVWGYVARDVRDEGQHDLNGHGTHVAGTIAGKTYGVAKKARLVSVKGFNATGASTSAGTLECILWTCRDYVSNRERNSAYKAVINLSIGSPPDPFTDALVNECTNWGILSIAAAMNDNQDACDASPARTTSAVTVAASNPVDNITSFSNWGSCVDIFAPGLFILSAGIQGPTSSHILSGTSMAAPHVTGAAARILSGQMEITTPYELKAKLMALSTRDKINLPFEKLHTINRMLYIPCATIVEEKKETPQIATEILAITATTLAVSVLILVAAIFILCHVTSAISKMKSLLKPSVPYEQQNA